MNAILAIASHNIKNLYRNSVFWVMLVLFPLAELLLFSRIFKVPSGELISDSVVKLIQLNPIDVSMSFNTLAIIVLGQFLMISSVIAASLLIKEKEQKTLMRALTLPISKAQLFLGFLISLIAQIAAATTLVMVLGNIAFDIQWASDIWSLSIVTVLSIFLAASLGFFISTVFKNGNLAGGVMSGVVIMMTFLNGDMTNGQLIFSKSDFFTINKWIKSAFVGVSQGQPLTGIQSSLLMILLLGTIFLISSIALFNKENMYE